MKVQEQVQEQEQEQELVLTLSTSWRGSRELPGRREARELHNFLQGLAGMGEVQGRR